jgi:hypothetical protein
MGGGSENPILTFTSAVVGIGRTIANAKRIVPNINFFIWIPPLAILFSLPRFRIGATLG